MTGVLVLAHGSRRKSTEETLDQVVAMTRAKLPGVLIEAGYMEFSERGIAVCLADMARRGCDDIAVVPYFLFDGVHIHEDIPAEIDAFRKDHPGVRVRLGGTLGADERLADLLADRIRQAL